MTLRLEGQGKRSGSSYEGTNELGLRPLRAPPDCSAFFEGVPRGRSVSAEKEKKDTTENEAGTNGQSSGESHCGDRQEEPGLSGPRCWLPLRSTPEPTGSGTGRGVCPAQPQGHRPAQDSDSEATGPEDTWPPPRLCAPANLRCRAPRAFLEAHEQARPVNTGTTSTLLCRVGDCRLCTCLRGRKLER